MTLLQPTEVPSREGINNAITSEIAAALGFRGTVATYMSSASASVANGGWVTVGGFSTVLLSGSDTAALTDLGCTYGSGIITITTAGVFTISIRFNSAAAATGLFGARLLVNGNARGQSIEPAWAADVSVEDEVTRRFDVGDQITIQCYNTTGAARAIRTGTGGSFFSVTRHLGS